MQPTQTTKAQTFRNHILGKRPTFGDIAQIRLNNQYISISAGQQPIAELCTYGDGWLRWKFKCHANHCTQDLNFLAEEWQLDRSEGKTFMCVACNCTYQIQDDEYEGIGLYYVEGQEV